MSGDKSKGHIRYARIFFLVLAAYTALMLVLAVPRVEDVLEAYRVKEHIALYREAPEMEYSTYTVILSTASGFTEAERTIERRGRDDLHLAIEALLQDESDVELASGAISYIPEGTKLRGVSMQDGCVFVDLSKEMRNAPAKAWEEIERTLFALEGPVDVTFMIEGKPVSV